jgi:hypothetical protein
MKKYPVVVSWTVERVVFIEANSEAGALDQALNEQLENGEALKDSAAYHILTPKA